MGRFLPLFDKHGVDLVLCGHDHHYERFHLVRGTESAAFTDCPQVVSSEGGEIDTTTELVQLVIGGGGPINLHPSVRYRTGTGRAATPIPYDRVVLRRPRRG